MLVPAIADFFKIKIAASIVVLACWSQNDQVRFLRKLSNHGMRGKFFCNKNFLLNTSSYELQGILYFSEKDSLLDKVTPEQFSIRYKWLIIGENVPSVLKKVRYDADITLVRLNVSETEFSSASLNFEDIYVHPAEGPSVHSWAVWSEKDRFQLEHENDRILRRNDLRKYPLKISTPLSGSPEANYNGSLHNYVMDNCKSVKDSALSCAYSGADLLANTLNATGALSPILLWTSKENNKNMIHEIATGQADISGGVLLPLRDRLQLLDYVMPLWPFRVGFTYLAERTTSGNMFMMPFSAGVWWSCLVTGLIIAAVQRVTAKTLSEREGALNAVLATFLQQDASAVPAGGSGRIAFTILSLWAMMLYAYYSSAIVSALMNTSQTGPVSLRELADSKYAIAAEEYDYVKSTIFDCVTDQPDLEYLKKKKKSSNFYQTMQRGVELLRKGRTAFHAEFNHIYPNLKTLSDDQVCKLAYIDTIPETLTWIVAPKHSQFTNVLRVASAKIHERGLAKRLVAHWRTWPAPCRAAVLVESITIGDVAPLVWISILGVALSLVLLVVEMLHAKLRKKAERRTTDGSDESLVRVGVAKVDY